MLLGAGTLTPEEVAKGDYTPLVDLLLFRGLVKFLPGLTGPHQKSTKDVDDVVIQCFGEVLTHDCHAYLVLVQEVDVLFVLLFVLVALDLALTNHDYTGDHSS